MKLGKVLLGLGLAGAIGGIVFAVTRKKPDVAGTLAQADLSMSILDANGNLVTAGGSLFEGDSGTAEVNIVNHSTLMGAGVRYTFQVILSIVAGSLPAIIEEYKSITLDPEASGKLSWNFNIPDGKGGQTANASAGLYDTDKIQLLKMASANFMIDRVNIPNREQIDDNLLVGDFIQNTHKDSVRQIVYKGTDPLGTFYNAYSTESPDDDIGTVYSIRPDQYWDWFKYPNYIFPVGAYLTNFPDDGWGYLVISYSGDNYYLEIVRGPTPVIGSTTVVPFSSSNTFRRVKQI